MSLHFKYFSSSLISTFFILCTHALAVPPVELSDDDSCPSAAAAVSHSKAEVDQPDRTSYTDMASSIERLEHALAEVQVISPQLRARNAILQERILFLQTFVPWAECVLFSQSESRDEKREFLQLCKDRVESKILASYPHTLKKTDSGFKVMHYGSGMGFWLKQYRLCEVALRDDEMYTDTFGQLVTLFGENIRNHCDRKSLVADEYIFDHVNLTINLQKPEEDAIPGFQEGVYNLTNEIFHKIAFEGRVEVFAAALEKRAARLEKREVDEMIVHLASLTKELQQSKELLLRINKAL